MNGNRSGFLRSLYAETLLENFFVSAVASLLAIRFYLFAAGFPQLGFGTLHIAHMLWGGLLMLAALVVFTAFLDYRSRVIASVIGGVGFGAFIDELGKFITSENDYFFQPAIALIYIIFVLIFFLIRYLSRRRGFSADECLANLFDVAQRGTLKGLDAEEKEEAQALLESCEPSPAREHLSIILREAKISPGRVMSPVAKFHSALDRFYGWAVARWWFSGIIITFFAFTAVTSVAAVVAAVEWSLGLLLWVAGGMVLLLGVVWAGHLRTKSVNLAPLIATVTISILIGWAVLGNLKGPPLTIIDWAQLIAPAVSGMLIVMGIFMLPRSRLKAYQVFRWAILVSIFLTQVLSFYEQQLFAALGLILDILILVALRYLIAHEHLKTRGPDGITQPGAPVR